MSYISTYEALVDAFNAQVNEAVKSISVAAGEGNKYSHESLQKLLDAMPDEFWQTGPYHDPNNYATWLSFEEQPQDAAVWYPQKAMLWAEGAGVDRASAESLSLDIINARMAMLAPAIQKVAGASAPMPSDVLQIMPSLQLQLEREPSNTGSSAGWWIAGGAIALGLGSWLLFRRWT